MAIKNIIAKGIGFSPGSPKYIVTHGFDIGSPPIVSEITDASLQYTARERITDYTATDRLADFTLESRASG